MRYPNQNQLTKNNNSGQRGNYTCCQASCHWRERAPIHSYLRTPPVAEADFQDLVCPTWRVGQPQLEQFCLQPPCHVHRPLHLVTHPENCKNHRSRHVVLWPICTDLPKAMCLPDLSGEAVHCHEPLVPCKPEALSMQGPAAAWAFDAQ